MILAILALAPAVQAYSDPLQMLTYNCNGLQKYSEKALGLLNLIKTVMPHVLILTETWQTAKDELKLPIATGHHFPASDSRYINTIRSSPLNPRESRVV